MIFLQIVMVSPGTEKSWVHVHNQWVPVKKKTSPNLKIPGPLFNQRVKSEDRHQSTVLQYTEIKI